LSRFCRFSRFETPNPKHQTPNNRITNSAKRPNPKRKKCSKCLKDSKGSISLVGSVGFVGSVGLKPQPQTTNHKQSNHKSREAVKQQTFFFILHPCNNTLIYSNT
jgi:hypothetical protein